MTHMISRLRCAQETMLVRLTARCQGGPIAAPIVELIRDGIGRLAVTATLLFESHEGAVADVVNGFNYGRRTGRAWDFC
jgi:hypothetical protein